MEQMTLRTSHSRRSEVFKRELTPRDRRSIDSLQETVGGCCRLHPLRVRRWNGAHAVTCMPGRGPMASIATCSLSLRGGASESDMKDSPRVICSAYLQGSINAQRRRVMFSLAVATATATSPEAIRWARRGQALRQTHEPHDLWQRSRDFGELAVTYKTYKPGEAQEAAVFRVWKRAAGSRPRNGKATEPSQDEKLFHRPERDPAGRAAQRPFGFRACPAPRLRALSQRRTSYDIIVPPPPCLSARGAQAGCSASQSGGHGARGAGAGGALAAAEASM